MCHGMTGSVQDDVGVGVGVVDMVVDKDKRSAHQDQGRAQCQEWSRGGWNAHTHGNAVKRGETVCHTVQWLAVMI